jgi:hypothetical protein
MGKSTKENKPRPPTSTKAKPAPNGVKDAETALVASLRGQFFSLNWLMYGLFCFSGDWQIEETSSSQTQEKGFGRDSTARQRDIRVPSRGYGFNGK